MTNPLTRQGGASIAAYRFDGQTYPFRTVSSCLTCQSPMRLEIERMIARGVPWSRIVTDLNLADGRNRVTTRSLKGHFEKGHMPVQAEAVRRVIERRATERGLDMDDPIQQVVDAQGFAEIVLQKTVERLGSGELAPNLDDGMSAAKLLAVVKPHEQASSEQDYVAAFLVYHSVAQEIMTPSQFEDFGRRLATHPVLSALMEKYRPEGEIMDDGEDFYAAPATALEELDIEDAVIEEED